MAWISALRVKSLRGISQELRVTLPTSKGHPTSLVVYGDNGTGKSSLCDSLEKAMLGQVRRGRSKTGPARPPLLFNAFSKHPLHLDLSLDDGTTISVSEGEAILEPRKVARKVTGTTAADERRVPFVLRRNEVLGFLSLAPDQRFAAFLEYLDADGLKAGADEELRKHLSAVEAEFADWTAKRQEAAEKFCRIMGIQVTADMSLLLDMKFNRSQLQDKKINLAEAVRAHAAFKQIYANRKRAKERYNEAFRLRPQGAQFERFAAIQQILQQISSEVTELFLNAQSPRVVDGIKFELGGEKDSRVQFLVEIPGQENLTPEEILSEANLDLLGILTFLAVLKKTIPPGQPKVLVLDDVLHSIDGPHRTVIAHLVAEKFLDWQLVVTTHDRLWARQLEAVLREKGHSVKRLDFLAWTREAGSRLALPQELPAQLSASVAEGKAVVAGALSGPTLEFILHQLSWRLETSIVRRQNDQYTIGDIWPSFRKRMKGTEIENICKNLDEYLHIRNLVGAHYNEWAESLSDQEVLTLASQISNLQVATHCNDCLTWISGTRIAPEARCSCGKISLKFR